jgi:hypothetical protein
LGVALVNFKIIKPFLQESMPKTLYNNLWLETVSEQTTYSVLVPLVTGRLKCAERLPATR